MLLMEHESKEILERYGIPTARCIFVQSEEEAIRAAREISFPVVMKVASRRIVHKSKVGGVRLDIWSEEGVKRNFRELMSIEGAEGVNVQKMLPRGIEVAIGVSENNQFGSVAMLALGGVLIEKFRRAVFRLLPLDARDAIEMVREIGLDLGVNCIIEILLKLNELVEKENVLEMDLNPVMVYKDKCVVADARMVIGRRKEFRYEIKDVEPFFKATSVAVIGASQNPLKVGNAVVKSLLGSKKKLKIYPINPSAKEIEDLRAYKSLLEVEDKIDLAMIAVPAENVLNAIDQCLAKKVPAAIIISSGFKEAELELGRELQEKLSSIAKEKGIRIIGPNVFGIVDVASGANYSFTPFFGGARKGKVALVSQSGGICHYLLHNSDIGFSKIIHLGNRCDVDFHDVMNFLSKDPETEVVAIYVEGLENGRAFYEELKKLVRVKRVVVMKAGRSRVADKASLSHTGSLAGDFEVFMAAVKQAGAIFVETPIELVDVAKILEKFPKISGDIAIVTIQAGLGIVTSDLIEEKGGRLAELEDHTKEELKRLLPPLTMRENPIDLSFTGLDPLKTRKVLELLENDKTVGIIVFLYAVAPPAWVIPVSVLKDVLNGLSKPVIMGYFSTREDFELVSKELKDISIVFSSLERLSAAVARISSSIALDSQR